MRAIELFLAVSVCLPAPAQTGIIMSGSSSSNNVGFSFETRLEPPSPPLKGLGGGGVSGGPSGTRRFMFDPATRQTFGYDIKIEPLRETDTYRVTFSPLSIRPDDSSNSTVVPLPSYPAPQTARRGDTVVLELFTHPGTGQKIVDYLHIGEREPRGIPAAGPARDFTLEDAELRLTKPRMKVNGKLEEPASAVGSVSGAWVQFYLPEHGRYFLSILPRPEFGFSKAGEIRGSSLSFAINGNTISLECEGRIAPGYGVYNLYVLHDAAWRPAGGSSGVQFGASDAPPQSLVRR